MRQPKQLSGRALMHLIVCAERAQNSAVLSPWGRTSVEAALKEAYQALEGVRIEVVEEESDA